MADEVQYRCAGFIQAEIERYADDLEGERPVQNDGSNDDSDSSDEVTPETHAKSNTRPKKGRVHRDTNNETNGKMTIFRYCNLLMFNFQTSKANLNSSKNISLMLPLQPF